MEKQTAVEWLGLELNMIFHDITPELWEQVNEIFKQAKQMEKEQIVNAFSEGTRMVDIQDELSARFNACVYYADTFKYQ
jgi:hypothetical protein